MKVLRRFALDVTPLRTSRDFRLVFAAAGISGFGSFITYVTIPYQVYAITHDPLLVGLLGLCEWATRASSFPAPSPAPSPSPDPA
ncbi:MAG TPA: hypothetical protein VI011_08325 [Asanoa sp.]